uniref:N-acetyltransferase domain-containing protein n=1 Tax=Kalanchoe fedtschenkoi TaxID=63787 RepID=A0A7N0T5C7_KALFE
MEESEAGLVVIREFKPSKDVARVEELERSCEVGAAGKMSILTDDLGDPLNRIRHSPSYLMLVAEIGSEIVGIIRGCIKTVTCGKKLARSTNAAPRAVPVCTKTAYLLGLRVSPRHRRLGVGLKLVQKMEDWFEENGVEYAYMATESENEPSLNLFTRKCGYTKFRTPCILVNPVHAHRVRISTRISIHKLTSSEAELLYRRRLATTEFFPRDIDAVLKNKLNLGTFVSAPSGYFWAGLEKFLSDPPESWAVVSVWNNNEVFKLEVRGASSVRKGLIRATRAVDRTCPWLGIPSVPDFFKPFGLHLLYGWGSEGPQARQMVRALCNHAHNLARKSGCGAVVTEVSGHDPIRSAIPHWKSLSCEEDVWCIKRLGEGYSDGSVGDWTKSPPGISIFVDPREF